MNRDRSARVRSRLRHVQAEGGRIDGGAWGNVTGDIEPQKAAADVSDQGPACEEVISGAVRGVVGAVFVQSVVLGRLEGDHGAPPDPRQDHEEGQPQDPLAVASRTSGRASMTARAGSWRQVRQPIESQQLSTPRMRAQGWASAKRDTGLSRPGRRIAARVHVTQPRERD